MEVQDAHIPEDTYAEFLAQMPQVCVELVVEHDGAVLLCRRTNEPAKGEWFWPGTRLYKGEELEAAALRLAKSELGVSVGLEEMIGVYSHFWQSSPFEDVDTQHTVNVVFHAHLREPVAAIDLDDQHDEYRLLKEAPTDPHEYVSLYLEESEILAG